MEAGKDNIRESLKWAAKCEVIHQRAVKSNNVMALTQDNASLIAAIEATGPDGLIPMDDDHFDEEEIAMINAIRQRSGRRPFATYNGHYRRPPPNGLNNGNGRQGNSVPTPAGLCYYCKRPGHLQKSCEARIKARAPMVDRFGKPYKKRAFVQPIEANNVNAVSAPQPPPPSSTPAAAAAPAHHVGSIVAGLNSLNW